MTDVSLPPLIVDLLRPEAYPHPVAVVQLRETHISWVLLSGEFAYKIKKPVDLGFVDFTTLERRRFFCEPRIGLFAVGIQHVSRRRGESPSLRQRRPGGGPIGACLGRLRS